jgi:hypothetical protein
MTATITPDTIIQIPKPMKTETSIPPKRHKPGPQPTRDERFYDLFKVVLQGLCAQFEQEAPDRGDYRYDGGKEELERSRRLPLRAWNIARFAEELFADQDKTIDEFNERLSK